MAKRKIKRKKKRKVGVLGVMPKGEITTRKRKALAKTAKSRKKNFVFPGKAKLGPKGGAPKGVYPIDTPERARAALHYASMWHGKNSSEYKKVKAKVCKKYPDMPICQNKPPKL